MKMSEVRSEQSPFYKKPKKHATVPFSYVDLHYLCQIFIFLSCRDCTLKGIITTSLLKAKDRE